MRILVIDDDPFAAEMTAAVLEAAGYEVVQAENGVEATEKLDQDPTINLIVSDMNMPLLSGIELFQELHRQGQTRPFILLSGDEPAELLALEPRLDACILKDFTLEQSLPPLVARLLARPLK